jgi:hypothetical protein
MFHVEHFSWTRLVALGMTVALGLVLGRMVAWELPFFRAVAGLQAGDHWMGLAAGIGVWHWLRGEPGRAGLLFSVGQVQGLMGRALGLLGSSVSFAACAWLGLWVGIGAPLPPPWHPGLALLASLAPAALGFACLVATPRGAQASHLFPPALVLLAVLG